MPRSALVLALSELESRAHGLRRLGSSRGARLLEVALTLLRKRLEGEDGLIEWISVAEASERMGSSPATIRRWLATGRLAGIRSGARWLVRVRGTVGEVDQFSSRSRGTDHG